MPRPLSPGRLVRLGVALGALLGACNTAAGLTDLDFAAQGGGGSGGGGSGGGGSGEGGETMAPKQSIGTPCSDNDQCASGSCTDGVCCDQACIGGCVTCGELGLYGTCVALTGETGDCDGGELCDAKGQCTPVEGGACTMGVECVSGYCVDDVCCNEPCDGSCESCIAAETGLVDGICAAPLSGDECAGSTCLAKGQCCGEGVPPSPGACPAACTGGCAGGTCTISCPEEGCVASNLVCPAGFDCAVECRDRHSCKDATIDCPADHRCDVVCGGGSPHHACERVLLTCTNGPCSVDCAPNADGACTEMTVQCGSNACDVTCDGPEPAMQCDASCSCATCS